MSFSRGGRVAAAIALVGAASAAPQKTPMEILEELHGTPRVVGTPGYDRAIEIVARELEARGVAFEREQVTAYRAIPRRSDVLLFDDGVATSALAGLRERWNPESPMPRPAAYDWNLESADVRAKVVDVGDGSERAYEQLDAQRVSVEGHIALISIPWRPIDRQVTLGTLVAQAAARGAAGVLIAPAHTGEDPPVHDFVLARHGLTQEEGDSNGRLHPVPVAPIRSIEANAIRERLRVRRVRGDDGSAVSLRVGPGPIEVRMTIECPVETIEATAIRVGEKDPRTASFTVSVEDAPWMPAGGAAALTAALASTAIDTEIAQHRSLVFEPLSVARDHHMRLGAALAPSLGGLPEIDGPTPGRAFHFTLDSQLPALLGESLESLDGRLNGTLAERLEAAAPAIARSNFGLLFATDKDLASVLARPIDRDD